MNRDPRIVGPPPRGPGGFTLVEVVVAMALLGLMVTTVLGGLLYGMTEARRGKVRAAAAAWAQSEVDYLRAQGYAGLADDVTAGTRTLTQTSGYTAHADLTEPRIPAVFHRTLVRVENVPGLLLRKVTLTLYETATSPPYTILSTYVANSI